MDMLNLAAPCINPVIEELFVSLSRHYAKLECSVVREALRFAASNPDGASDFRETIDVLHDDASLKLLEIDHMRWSSTHLVDAIADAASPNSAL
jgi:hypothetical protein